VNYGVVITGADNASVMNAALDTLEQCRKKLTKIFIMENKKKSHKKGKHTFGQSLDATNNETLSKVFKQTYRP